MSVDQPILAWFNPKDKRGVRLFYGPQLANQWAPAPTVKWSVRDKGDARVYMNFDMPWTFV